MRINREVVAAMLLCLLSTLGRAQDPYIPANGIVVGTADPPQYPGASHVDGFDDIYARLNALEASLNGQSRSTPTLQDRREADEATPHAAGGGSKAAGGDPTTTLRPQHIGKVPVGKLPLDGYYDYEHGGFQWTTPEDEYAFGVSGLVQLDGRMYSQPTPGVASSGGVYNPRSRLYFQGHFTKPIQYTVSVQNTFDSVGLTDAYLNFNYDSRFQVRFGRFKTPFTYEFYRVHVWDLLAPERSLFANNYEANRRFGLMGWGSVWENRLEYAVGMFNTQRNSFQPHDNLQDFMAFLNFKPFYNCEEEWVLRDLQFGGSVDAGDENQPVLPAALRTNSAPSGAAVGNGSAADAATVPFLAFRPGVVELGSRALWEMHAALYHGGLSMLAAWHGGHESYALAAGGVRTAVPIHGWFAQTGFILTGETLRDRTLIDPLSPFDPRCGSFGIGAWELTARYSDLTLDSNVFTAGFADPTLWTNRAQLVDVGANWYLNKFTKVYFDWEHAIFASPVLSGAGPAQKSNDMFWIRTQVFF